MKRFVLAATVLASCLAASPARAGYDIPGDGRLVVENAECRYINDPAFCGPALVVRIPAGVSVYDGEATITSSLESSSGPVGTEYSYLVPSNGAMLTDTSYWNYRTEVRAATNLPFGTYTYKWNYSYPGQWKCSKYFREGCIWIDDEAFTWKYLFDWQGTRIDTFPVQDKVPEIESTENNVTAASAKTLSTPKLADYMTGAGYNYSSTDKLTLKVMSGSACKLVKGSIRTVRKGTCKVKLTATTERGWQYVFKFIVKVK